MARDRASLQGWYRQAMAGRADELRGLLDGLREGAAEERAAARDVGMALRGSGATFGFPEISDVAALVEASPDEDLLRRVEGLIGELGAITREDGGGPSTDAPEWLLRAAGLADADAAAPAPPIGSGWGPLAREAGLSLAELSQRAADYLGIAVADLASRRPAALRLVPEAFVASAGVVPLTEDSETITVASADPASLADERELELLTGRRPVFVIAPPEAIEAVLAEIYGSDADAPDEGPTSDGPDHPADRGGPAPAPPEEVGRTLLAGPHPDAARPEVAVPRSAAAQSADEAPSAPGSGRGHLSVDDPSDAAEGAVLVVDDEPSARLLVRTLLERRGYDVVEAEDGVAALEALTAPGGIGLVVADLNMPRMDGLELLWELRDAHRGVRLPVIVVTGEADEILETQLMEEGADDYIRKPLDPRLFLARVESTVRRVGAHVTRTTREAPES